MQKLYVEPSLSSQKILMDQYQILKENENFYNEEFTINHSVALFKEIYNVYGLIGQGSFGLVLAGSEKSTNSLCAIKVIMKR